MRTILKATSKGQITLPASWRRHFSTNHYLAKDKGGKLEISPFNIKSLEEKQEYTVFDAIRDNQGRGVKAKDLLKILRKLA